MSAGASPLTPHLAQRYARQILLAPIGGGGQQKIRGATLLLIGDAPLAARYLAGAGLGRLLYRGPRPDVLSHEPSFECAPAPGADRAEADFVLDFADGSHLSSCSPSGMWAGAVGDRVLVDAAPAQGRHSPAARSVAEILAAGEALQRLMGHAPKRYAFDLGGPA